MNGYPDNKTLTVTNYINRFYWVYCLVFSSPLALLGLVTLQPDVKPLFLSGLVWSDLVMIQMQILGACVLVLILSSGLFWMGMQRVKKIRDLNERLEAYFRLFALRMSLFLGAGLAAIFPVLVMPDHYMYNFAGFALLLMLLALIANLPDRVKIEKHLRLSEEEWDRLKDKRTLV